MNGTNSPTHLSLRHELFAVACLEYLGIAMHDRIGPVAKRSANCATAISAYRQLSDAYGVVDNATYHRELSSIFYHFGFDGDADRECRKSRRIVATRD